MENNSRKGDERLPAEQTNERFFFLFLFSRTKKKRKQEESSLRTPETGDSIWCMSMYYVTQTHI